MKVVVVHPHLPEYRVAFFTALKGLLETYGVSLGVIYGESRDQRFVRGYLQWAREVPVLKFKGFIWHRAFKLCSECDLVIVPQEVKFLIAHALFFKSKSSAMKFAFWGHGKNFQAINPNSPAECLKRYLSRRVDWWFAYNELSASVVRDLGYPPQRITSVGNTIDTSSLAKMRECVTALELAAIRSELGITSDNVAVYTGGLYPIKRIGFLIEAAKRIRERIPDFELIVIGDGPDRRIVSEAAYENRWIHDVGTKNDCDKVPYWALSKLLLMPGGVGLVILDSFALGVPMVTTDTRLHGPEIDYLKNNENGLLVSCGDSTETYALAVVELLSDSERLGRLRCGTLASAQQHTVEDMVDNFAGGIMDALKSPKYRRSSR